jgi:tetratricopeptide (TPR) repeat protein
VNLQRGYYQMLGQVNWALERPEAALNAYEKAVEANPANPETYYDLGLVLERLGRLEEAARTYRWGWDRQANYLPCSAALGNVRRRLGRLEEAKIAFRGRFVADKDVVDWTWEHLEVIPLAELDLGNGLEYGYVTGVYAAESTGGVDYRWTGGQSSFRLAPTTSGQVRLRLRLAAPRLGDSLPVVAEVWIAGERLAFWELAPNWAIYETPALPAQAGTTIEVVLRSGTFIPQEIDPGVLDTRVLGMQVDWIRIVTGITAHRALHEYYGCTPFP